MTMPTGPHTLANAYTCIFARIFLHTRISMPFLAPNMQELALSALATGDSNASAEFWLSVSWWSVCFSDPTTKDRYRTALLAVRQRRAGPICAD